MLVLSRKKNETIVFPSIDATVEVLQIKGSVARIGVKAPRNVTVLRGELESHDEESARTESEKRSLRHATRNWLNTASVGLCLLKKQMAAGMTDAAEQTIQTILDGVGEMSKRVESESDTAKGQRRRALVVEDDDNERFLLAGFLRACGFDVEAVCDGEKAIEFLQQCPQKPDVVLMDMHMPRCDGSEAVRVIRQDPRHQGLKIYAVSGSDPSELGANNVFDRWIPKPFDPQKLVSEISRELALAN